MRDFYIETGENINIHKDTVWTLWFLAKDSLEVGEINQFLDIFEILKRTRTELGSRDLSRIISSLTKRYQDYSIEISSKLSESPKLETKDLINEEYDDNLFEILRGLRKKLADKEGMPPFFIFYDLSLKAMATYFPKDLQSLGNIEGVDEKKLEKYGELFLEEIVNYCTQRDINTKMVTNKSSSPLMKDEAFSDKSKVYSVEAIRKKNPRAYEPWTKEDDEKLIAEYKSGKTTEELMELLGRQRGGINSRLRKLGIISTK